ncbi:MAG: DUF3574 domain-containing protein [Oscillospiraceae bacterium]|nr:DUF3574 domain-containing protein [Oscillospiraceae bacterium]
MRQKLKKQRRLAKEALTGQLSALLEQKDAASGMQMTETRIYIGLYDAVTREQLYDTQTYLDVLKDVCRSYHAAFSVDIEEGGYYHEDGEYTEETSLVLILIDADRDLVQKIAQELRTRFHQESVLVTEDRISGFFLGEEASN